jgi:hypothetical protein
MVPTLRGRQIRDLGVTLGDLENRVLPPYKDLTLFLTILVVTFSVRIRELRELRYSRSQFRRWTVQEKTNISRI